jgi:transmembrane sensor
VSDQLFQDETLLGRWLGGTLSAEERAALEAHPDFPAFERLVAAADRLSLPDPEVQAMWARLAPILQETPKSAPPTRRRLIWWLAAAAAFAGILILAWPLLRGMGGAAEIVQTGIGEQKTVVLPDGSRVRLNAQSKLTFDTRNWKQLRRLQMDGEAYFEVQHDPGAPFLVDVPTGAVRVLGASFDIKARPEVYEVRCYTGYVSASTRAKYEVVLRGGQRATAQSADGDWNPMQQFNDTRPAWAEGESRFDQARLREVLNELQRQYAVQVQAPGLDNEAYTGAFPHNNLDLALRLVCEPLGLKAERQGKSIQIKKAGTNE